MRTKSPDRTVHERVTPRWYQWLGVAVPGVVALITSVNRTDEFGLSTWVANLVVLLICVTGLGLVTYFKSNFVSMYSLVGSIVVGSLGIAMLSNLLPVIVVTYGSLWAGCGLGFLIGIALTAGELR